VLEIGSAPFGVADQPPDALPFPAEIFQQFRIFGSVSCLDLHADALRQRGAAPTGRDGDLQGTTPHDGRCDEIAGLRRIDDVHPDAVSSCRLAYGQIHVCSIGGADDQGAAQHIVHLKWAALMLNDALRRESCQGFRQLGADHDHHCPRLKQSFHFARGDLSTADH
jgi:hypothetical protein